MTVSTPPAQRPSSTQVFARQGFVIVNRFAPEPALAKTREHLTSRAAAGTVITDDEQVPGTPSVYGGVVLDGLMEELRPTVEHCTGLRLYPTYSYGRLYRHGDAQLYRGIELTHWRELYAGTSMVQLFRHYVDQDGSYAEQKFDRRPVLAMPFATRITGNS